MFMHAHITIARYLSVHRTGHRPWYHKTPPNAIRRRLGVGLQSIAMTTLTSPIWQPVSYLRPWTTTSSSHAAAAGHPATSVTNSCPAPRHQACYRRPIFLYCRDKLTLLFGAVAGSSGG